MRTLKAMMFLTVMLTALKLGCAETITLPETR